MTRPSDNEEEFVLKQELQERRKRVRAEQASMDEDERTALKTKHWMRCAKCGAEMQEVEFRGVKVDKCFSCGGVYLDDGELEQLAGRPGWFDSMVKLFRA